MCKKIRDLKLLEWEGGIVICILVVFIVFVVRGFGG